ncbi:LysR substrate-binding domain-containing protein [Kiloniella sp.]|uniref:LysR substrate-binding domain-containing protein n=1 Tax=Kiloniella sp. TaxID=1938587 RepID=UPI003A939CE8
MMRKLPPLNSLRSFDAIARNGSISKAALELKVSSSAVSQQVSILEDWMGVKFLKRTSNKTSLTREGVEFANEINSVFDTLEKNIFHTQKKVNHNEIKLSIIPSLATRWLINRLPIYSALYPDYSVMVEASFDLVDFTKKELTIAIRSGAGSYSGCQSEKLFDEYITPVCSPEYWKKNKTSLVEIGACSLLADHTFGKDETNLNWTSWIAREGIIPSTKIQPIQFYTDSNLTIQACINGEGFMLGRSILINEELRKGGLIEPFKEKQVSDWPYYIVYHSINDPLRGALRSFIEWLKREAAKTPGIVR